MNFVRKLKINEEIPTASLSDIAFLLIIFFMVATTFAASKGIDLQLPQQYEKINGDFKNFESILIEIKDNGRILIDRNPINLKDIQPYVATKLSNNPSKPVIIKVDSEAYYGRLIDVLDELKQIDVKNIVLPSKEEIKSWGDLY